MPSTGSGRAALHPRAERCGEVRFPCDGPTAVSQERRRERGSPRSRPQPRRSACRACELGACGHAPHPGCLPGLLVHWSSTQRATAQRSLPRAAPGDRGARRTLAPSGPRAGSRPRGACPSRATPRRWLGEAGGAMERLSRLSRPGVPALRPSGSVRVDAEGRRALSGRRNAGSAPRPGARCRRVPRARDAEFTYGDSRRSRRRRACRRGTPSRRASSRGRRRPGTPAPVRDERGQGSAQNSTIDPGWPFRPTPSHDGTRHGGRAPASRSCSARWRTPSG